MKKSDIMKHLRLVAALLAALILIVSLCSCESRTEPTETTEATTEATEATEAAVTTAPEPAEEPVRTPIIIEDGHKYTTYRRANDPRFEGVTDYFTITLRDDGECQYYATLISSYIGMCRYEIKGDILTITDDSIPGLYGTLTKVYKFKIVGDTLVFLADESNEFMYVKLPDGAVFEKKTD